MRSAEKSENKLGTWLAVKKEDGSYLETGIDGEACRFTVEEQIVEVGIKYRLLRSIDPDTGKHDVTVKGSIDAKFGMIGVTNEYPIYDVQLRAGDGPAIATFTHLFWKMGHSGHSELDIKIPQHAFDYVIDSVERSRYPQQIVIRFKGAAFYQNPELTRDDEMNRIHYLPWIEELQKQVQPDGNVMTTYSPPIVDLQIQAAHSGPFTADNDYRLDVGVTSAVGVYPHKQLAGDIHSAQAQLHTILAGINTKISALIVIAVIAAVLHLLWR